MRAAMAISESQSDSRRSAPAGRFFERKPAHTLALRLYFGEFLESAPLDLYNILWLIHFSCFNSYRVVLALQAQLWSHTE